MLNNYHIITSTAAVGHPFTFASSLFLFAFDGNRVAVRAQLRCSRSSMLAFAIDAL